MKNSPYCTLTGKLWYPQLASEGALWTVFYKLKIWSTCLFCHPHFYFSSKKVLHGKLYSTGLLYMSSPELPAFVQGLQVLKLVLNVVRKYSVPFLNTENTGIHEFLQRMTEAICCMQKISWWPIVLPTQCVKASPDTVLIKFACKTPEEFAKWALLMQ